MEDTNHGPLLPQRDGIDSHLVARTRIYIYDIFSMERDPRQQCQAAAV